MKLKLRHWNGKEWTDKGMFKVDEAYMTTPILQGLGNSDKEETLELHIYDMEAKK